MSVRSARASWDSLVPACAAVGPDDPDDPPDDPEDEEPQAEVASRSAPQTAAAPPIAVRDLRVMPDTLSGGRGDLAVP